MLDLQKMEDKHVMQLKLIKMKMNLKVLQMMLLISCNLMLDLKVTMKLIYLKSRKILIVDFVKMMDWNYMINLLDLKRKMLVEDKKKTSRKMNMSL